MSSEYQYEVFNCILYLIKRSLTGLQSMIQSYNHTDIKDSFQICDVLVVYVFYVLPKQALSTRIHVYTKHCQAIFDTYTHVSHSFTVALEYTSTELFTNRHHYIHSVSTCNPYITRLHSYITNFININMFN